jgi:hypothetical protein
MNTRRLSANSGRRAKTGAAILAVAQVAAVRPVSSRLTAFASAHRQYLDAHLQIDTAETQLREAQAQLVLRDAEQDAAVETLARALVAEGQPRRNPFAAFAADAPAQLKEMPCAAEATAIHQLVAAVRRHPSVGQTTLQAAHTTEDAAQRVEAALAAVTMLQRTLRSARRARDERAQAWDTALAVLKRGARAAADDGAPGLYKTLFATTAPAARSNGKPARPAEEKAA